MKCVVLSCVYACAAAYLRRYIALYYNLIFIWIQWVCEPLEHRVS
jgi:hypothetical protein